MTTPTPPDVTQAAERLRIYRANPSEDIEATWMYGDLKFGRAKVMADMLCVANWAIDNLIATPTDDGPVTVEWMLSFGFEPRNDAGFWLEGDWADMTVVQYAGGEWFATIEDEEHSKFPVPLSQNTVRQLAAILKGE